MKELITRSLTALVYGLLLIGSVLLHPLAFFFVYLGLSLLCINEFFTLSRRLGMEPQRIPGLVIAGTVFIIPFLLYYVNTPKIILVVIPSLIITALIIELFRKKGNPFENLGILFMGLIYIAAPMAMINELLFNTYSPGFSAQLLIFLFMVLWINDTGAYLIGSLLGRNKLWERLSPKKTWEGLFGGAFVALLSAFFLGGFFTEIPAFDRWVITVIIIIFGTFGDLFESMLKRSLKIKDSGKALPGHGGWLDRLDGILFVVPAVLITVIILKSA